MVGEIEFEIEELKSIDTLGDDWTEYRPKNAKPWMLCKYLYFKKRIYSIKNAGVFFTVLLRCNTKRDNFRLRVRGNLYEWYYGGLSNQNLSLAQYKECISHLSKKIGLAERILWQDAVIRKIVIGLNISLKKPWRSIPESYSWYKHFKSPKKHGSTVNYSARSIFDNYNFIFISKNSGRVEKSKFTLCQAKEDENYEYHFLRFEIAIDRSSEPSFHFACAKFPYMIRKHWKEIHHKLISALDSIEFCDETKELEVVKKISRSAYNIYIQEAKIREKILRELKNNLESTL